MRYLRDIPHPHFRVGLYNWNNKHIIKIEVGYYEQVYKISEMDVASEEEVIGLLDEPFMLKVAERFRQMHDDFAASVERHELG